MAESITSGYKRKQDENRLFSRAILAESAGLAAEQSRMETFAELFFDKVRQAGLAKPVSYPKSPDRNPR